MLKYFVSTCMLGLAVFAANAVEGSVAFSYVGDSFESWGKGKSEIYDVAIRLEDPFLVGKKITGIRALISSAEGLESTSLWLSKELTLDKVNGVKVTVPDTYSAEVAPEPATLPGGAVGCGQLSAMLDTPYVMTEEGIYVGYSLTVPAVPKGETLTEGQKAPLMLSPSGNPLSFYIRASKDILKWMPYNDRTEFAAAIYVTVEGDFPEYSVGIKDIADAYVAADEDFFVKAKLSNSGVAQVTSLQYSYLVAGSGFEGEVKFSEPIMPDITGTVSVDLPIQGISEYGDFDLDVTVTKVNGHENVNAGASASCGVKVLPFVPVHRPMLEEFTGTWCGWCPRGFYALEALSEIYGDRVVLAAYHVDDPMQATSSLPIYVDGLPSSTLNRNGDEDPYYGKSMNGFGMKEEVRTSMEIPVLADIKVEAVWSDYDRNTVSVVAEAVFLEDMKDAAYKVGFLLTNDGLSGSGPSWAQSNYFAGSSQYAGTDLEVLTTWPSKATGLVYNDVVVDASGMMGVEGSIPAEVEFNTTYQTGFSFDIAGNSVIQDKDRLYVAAFIINPDGTILNSNKVKVVEGSAVAEIEAAEVSAECYDLSGARIAAPGKGVFVKLTRLADGSFRTTKIIR